VTVVAGGNNSHRRSTADSDDDKEALQSRCLAELNDVLRFFCLDFGCQHKRGEISLSSGSLDSTCTVRRCNTCPICNRTYHKDKDFIPVYRTGAVSYLEWLIVTSTLLFAFDLKIQVSSLLMCSEYWKEIIFDKLSSSISRTNVDALFLSLAASGILEIQNTTDGIKWVIGRQPLVAIQTKNNVTLIDATIGEAKYKVDKYWMGISLHSETRIRVCTPATPTS